MSRGGSSSSKLVSWFWRAPRRALGRARDLYVRSLIGCAGHLPPDAAFGYPSFGGAAAAPLPRAGSFASPRRSGGGYDDNDDLRELIRAASQRRATAEEPVTVPRSQSVAMARIDEDRPCEFAGAGAGFVFTRSRSCAVGAGRVGGRRGRVAALAKLSCS